MKVLILVLSVSPRMIKSGRRFNNPVTQLWQTLSPRPLTSSGQKLTTDLESGQVAEGEKSEKESPESSADSGVKTSSAWGGRHLSRFHALSAFNFLICALRRSCQMNAIRLHVLLQHPASDRQHLLCDAWPAYICAPTASQPPSPINSQLLFRVLYISFLISTLRFYAISTARFPICPLIRLNVFRAKFFPRESFLCPSSKI